MPRPAKFRPTRRRSTGLTFAGYRRPDRKSRHAQLHRRHFDRQLLGLGQQRRRGPVRRRSAETISQRRRRRGLYARRRLRHAVRRRRTRHAQPRDGRHRAASQHRRLRADRAGLRNGHARLFARRSEAGADRRRGRRGRKRPPVFSMQDVGGTTKTIEAACDAGRANACRTPTTCGASRFRSRN